LAPPYPLYRSSFFLFSSFTSTVFVPLFLTFWPPRFFSCQASRSLTVFSRLCPLSPHPSPRPFQHCVGIFEFVLGCGLNLWLLPRVVTAVCSCRFCSVHQKLKPVQAHKRRRFDLGERSLLPGSVFLFDGWTCLNALRPGLQTSCCLQVGRTPDTFNPPSISVPLPTFINQYVWGFSFFVWSPCRFVRNASPADQTGPRISYAF